MKILFGFDVEADLHRYIHSPYVWHKITKKGYSNVYTYSPKKLNAYKTFLKWKLNILKSNYAKGREGFENLLHFFKKNKIKASFFICGHLYLKESFFDYPRPEAKWFLYKDWYYWNPNSNFRENPGFYCGDLIEKYKSNIFDFGLHGFAHEALPLEKKEISNKIISLAVTTAKNLGVNTISFAPPFNMSDEKSNQNVLYDSLIVHGIKILREAGKDDYFNTFTHEKKFDEIKLLNRRLKIVRHTNSFEGTFSKKRIDRLIGDIKKKFTKKTQGIYCISGHDFTFRKNSSLDYLFSKLDKLADSFDLEFINCKDLI